MPNEPRPLPKPGEPHYRDPSEPRVASPPPPPKRFVGLERNGDFVGLVRIDASDLAVTPQDAPLSAEMERYSKQLEYQLMLRIFGYK